MEKQSPDMFLECCVMCKLLQEMQDTNGTVKDVRLMHIYIKKSMDKAAQWNAKTFSANGTL